jgi:hypothetical protein
MLTIIFFFALLFSVGSILLFITKLVMAVANKKMYNVIDVILLLFLAVCLWTLFYHLNH